MGNTKDPVVTVLDTAQPAVPSDTGPDQTAPFSFITNNIPLRFTISLGVGDTVVIESKSESGDTYVAIHTWDSDLPTPADVFVGHLWRAKRTVDGGGESVVKVENISGLTLDTDE